MSPKTRKNPAELSIAWPTKCKSHEIRCPRFLAMKELTWCNTFLVSTDRNDRFPYPFIYLRPEKRYPFRAEPPRIGHHREYAGVQTLAKLISESSYQLWWFCFSRYTCTSLNITFALISSTLSQELYDYDGIVGVYSLRLMTKPSACSEQWTIRKK